MTILVSSETIDSTLFNFYLTRDLLLYFYAFKGRIVRSILNPMSLWFVMTQLLDSETIDSTLFTFDSTRELLHYFYFKSAAKDYGKIFS